MRERTIAPQHVQRVPQTVYLQTCYACNFRMGKHGKISFCCHSSNLNWFEDACWNIIDRWTSCFPFAIVCVYAIRFECDLRDICLIDILLDGCPWFMFKYIVHGLICSAASVPASQCQPASVSTSQSDF